ncbi:PTS sugar transporter subunit IIA [Halothiobacillus sp. DCM-1]|uniref:PTS sugar transporter subunit IIA n=1 Tax=Halothiobacillus sp. DCM-1 TaxID=3112558 RepID=UPI0032492CF3
MNAQDLFPLSRIRIDEVYQSRKRVLEVLAGLLADDELNGANATRIYELLIERERLGCTAIGHGIAIPHARDTQTLRPRGAVIRLTEGVDFGATDGVPTVLVIGLIIPDESPEHHLHLLSALASHLREAEDRESILQAQSLERVRALLIEWLNPLFSTED